MRENRRRLFARAPTPLDLDQAAPRSRRARRRLAGAARKELHDALIVAFDLYTWKPLRRDFGLSRRAAEATLIRMVQGLIGKANNG